MSPTRFRQCHDEPGYFEAFQKPVRGAGDIVAKITSAIGIKPCSGCQQRQETLNDLFPL